MRNALQVSALALTSGPGSLSAIVACRDPQNPTQTLDRSTATILQDEGTRFPWFKPSTVQALTVRSYYTAKSNAPISIYQSQDLLPPASVADRCSRQFSPHHGRILLRASQPWYPAPPESRLKRSVNTHKTGTGPFHACHGIRAELQLHSTGHKRL